jgi:uncharacterized Zn-binding protein involved in type VI secretion
MFNAVCRIGDIVTGTCNNHTHPRSYTGTWDAGSTDVYANGISLIRKGDTGTTDCGHTFVADGGSTAVDSDGLQLQRVGDTVTVIGGGDGISITGSLDVTSN